MYYTALHYTTLLQRGLEAGVDVGAVTAAE